MHVYPFFSLTLLSRLPILSFHGTHADRQQVTRIAGLWESTAEGKREEYYQSNESSSMWASPSLQNRPLPGMSLVVSGLA